MQGENSYLCSTKKGQLVREANSFKASLLRLPPAGSY